VSPTVLHHPAQASHWLRERVRGSLRVDSRQVQPGDGFIAWPGAATDGRRFVAHALAQGASACLVEHEGAASFGFEDPRIASYAGLKADAGPIAANYFEQPSHRLQVLAVTGTNGKTSSAWWLAQALRRACGIRCGFVGTLGVGEPPQFVPTGLTTPDPVTLQQAFRQFADAGFSACAMEASSIGLAEQRMAGTQVHVALLTNLTPDHLDYHGDMARYWQAKRALFDWPGLQATVLNIDDAHGQQLAAALADRGLDLWTVSTRSPARLHAQHIGYHQSGLRFEVVEAGQSHALSTDLVGGYNVSNLLGVMAGLRALGIPLATAVQACAGLLPVPGRMSVLSQPGQPLVVVDYAHTPDALDQALQALRPLATQRGGRLWCVFGCGGNRDASKRPLMAALAEQRADQLLLTSDNPRDEKPESILSHILLGLSQPQAAQVQADRAAAIASAVQQARATDVVLIAGKGHEREQEIAGHKYPFDDSVHAQAALQRRAGGQP